jgi:hypothetical protein
VIANVAIETQAEKAKIHRATLNVHDEMTPDLDTDRRVRKEPMPIEMIAYERH